MSTAFIEDPLQDVLDDKIQEYERLRADRKLLKREASQKFNTIKVKLDNERESNANLQSELKKLNEEYQILQQEGQTFKRRVEDMQIKSANIAQANESFIKHVLSVLQLQNEKDIIPTIKQLLEVPPRVTDLREKLAEIDSPRHLNSSQSNTGKRYVDEYVNLIESLRLIHNHIKTVLNSESVTQNEEIRNLFTSILRAIEVSASENLDSTEMEAYLKKAVQFARLLSPDPLIRQMQTFDRSVADPFVE